MKKKSIVLPIVGIVITGILTIIAALANLGNMVQISEAKELNKYERVKYNGKVYTRSDLIDQLKTERTGLFVFLFISAVLLALCIYLLVKRIKSNRQLPVQGAAPMQFGAQPMPPMGAPVQPAPMAGAPVQAAAVCPHCGAPRKEGQVFCANCGKQM